MHEALVGQWAVGIARLARNNVVPGRRESVPGVGVDSRSAGVGVGGVGIVN